MSRLRLSPPPTSEDPLINLTPLIDVVFVILIAFILIAPLLQVDNVSLSSGKAQNSEVATPAESPIVIMLTADATLLWNRQPIAIHDLPRFMQQARLEHPEAIPQVFPDQKAPFGMYQLIKNSAEEAGFSEIHVLLQPGKE